ncbi:MAG: translation initiation factor IF-2 subunit beta [Candidatus Hodarchaeales archaeon]|jgi:translation initiation factor 2 subunit 2
MEKDQYLTLLGRAREQLPKEVFEKSRFEIPKIQSFTEGNRTHITNWKDVTKIIRRDEHFIKLMAREFATSISEESGRLIFQGKFTASSLNKQLSTYVRTYVICPECSKPDTKLIKDDRMLILVCEACGARHSVK